MLVVALLHLGPTPALAQQPAATSQPTRTVDFEKGDTVDGQVENPDGVVETGRSRVPPRSLIRVRTDFNGRLLQVAETL